MSDTNDWNDWEHRELHKELAELKVENALLRQDKERLEWLISVQSIWESRDEIDEDMAENPTMGESL